MHNICYVATSRIQQSYLMVIESSRHVLPLNDKGNLVKDIANGLASLFSALPFGAKRHAEKL